LSPYILSSIYFAYFQLYLRYAIILWGGDNESKMAFKVQTRVIQIMSGANFYKNPKS
jgi:hypothetical protein